MVKMGENQPFVFLAGKVVQETADRKRFEHHECENPHRLPSRIDCKLRSRSAGSSRSDGAQNSLAENSTEALIHEAKLMP